MKGWIYARYGGPEVLEWADLPDPAPGRGEVAVRVVACALNPLDWKLRAGQLRFMTAGRLPRGVGYDFAGVVESVGEGLTRLERGEAVVGILHPMKSGNSNGSTRWSKTLAVTLAPLSGLPSSLRTTPWNSMGVLIISLALS